MLNNLKARLYFSSEVLNIQCTLLLRREKANAGHLTNFEVLDFLRIRGAKTDPMGCLGAVAASECKVLICFSDAWSNLCPFFMLKLLSCLVLWQTGIRVPPKYSCLQPNKGVSYWICKQIWGFQAYRCWQAKCSQLEANLSCWCLCGIAMFILLILRCPLVWYLL